MINNSLPGNHLSKSKLSRSFGTVVNAGTDLSAPRPSNAASVYWKFSAGVVVGSQGSNITNAQPGDTFFVANS